MNNRWIIAPSLFAISLLAAMKVPGQTASKSDPKPPEKPAAESPATPPAGADRAPASDPASTSETPKPEAGSQQTESTVEAPVEAGAAGHDPVAETGQVPILSGPPLAGPLFRNPTPRQRELQSQIAEAQKRLQDLYSQLGKLGGSRLSILTAPSGFIAPSSPGNQWNTTPFFFSPGMKPSLGEIGQRNVTLQKQNADPMQTMTELLTQANASYVIGGDTPAGKKVSFNFQNVPLEEALGAVAEAAGLNYHLRGNVIILSQGGPIVYSRTLSGALDRAGGDARFSGPQSADPNARFPFDYKPVPAPVYNHDHDIKPSTKRAMPLRRNVEPRDSSDPNLQNGNNLSLALPESDYQARSTMILRSIPYPPGQPQPRIKSITSDGIVVLDNGPATQQADIRKETIRLKHLTVSELFDNLDLPVGGYRLSWNGQIRRDRNVPNGIVRVDGGAKGRRLYVEGTPDAIRRLRDRIRQLDRAQEPAPGTVRSF